MVSSQTSQVLILILLFCVLPCLIEASLPSQEQSSLLTKTSDGTNNDYMFPRHVINIIKLKLMVGSVYDYSLE